MPRVSLLAMVASGVLFPATTVANPISFTREVVPVLTRLGCNQGACHGTPTGKGGFRLSLRGYDASLDQTTLTREAAARRVNPLAPEASLLLQKGTGQVPHEGGVRLRLGSPEYRVLRDWIAAGSPVDSASALAISEIRIESQALTLEPDAAIPPMRVWAMHADGSRGDVTGLTRFSVSNDAIARISQDGILTRLRAGEVAVIAEYRNLLTTMLVNFLPPKPEKPWPTPVATNPIDAAVYAKLAEVRIQPSGNCTDAEFLRRSTLDVIGKLPTAAETRAFLSDPTPSASKRDRWIDSLLERPEFADFWAMKWADRLGCNQRFVGITGARKYHAWIRERIAANVPEDHFVREILTASGPNYSHAPASFFRRLRDPEMRAEEIAQLFLGVRMQCARCHNHPGERWTQDDYHALAAFFARISYRDGPFFDHIYNKEETVWVPRAGEWRHPRTGQAMPPKFLGGPQPTIPESLDRRAVFADWLTAPDNPFFARAAVNRIWYHLLGRGIVDPVDDLRATNPPSVPALLDHLAQEFVRLRYDRKAMIRQILRSQTYQATSQPTESNADDETYFSHARLRLLGAEQLLDAVTQVTGVPEKFAGFPLGVTAIQMPDGEMKHPFLEAFGRPARALACECERGVETTFAQALQLIGGRAVQDRLRHPTGQLAQWLNANLADEQLIQEMVLTTWTRLPTPQETQLLRSALQVPPNQRRQAAEDVLWSLLNHREFLFRY
ncbi:DUF1549 and DUF1553 domain-containing protein [Tuwongella immobilis]|uniref:BIG2 domain-containing protein n=1 Tax=Tuwongella immobilis TaxID=692036 RepID=A0A6C2YJ98_9BACT|nr:DUF1549 and DUF1553 domain-containing protein [Tuwongella immobilis]VIP01351.1 Ig-like domain-containing protein OS=Singulisphaera acidiphila (strain ATCC BAA-1392 / DSM 18658 / VKM B-2454 / MOB10) GN=Sinac_3198 PE=4 SV=1: PSCyt2: PSD1 [Tuwongella immobilis]VTR98146.1 Ig-like domain-containing protein OS=Singulisphaera acidiphila (strain ATCC BAA-1392 / DSM 18658 / VKM B-2454 / MOB10) GN=Sinac_3198 PE=4 SV=1: PSCyt2: PSD1 [Tuwongella immobilis]